MKKKSNTQISEERTHGRMTMTRKETKDKRKVSMTIAWTYDKARHIAAWRQKRDYNNLSINDEDKSEFIEETLDNDEELQAWYLLAESEYELWQEAFSRRDNKYREAIMCHYWVWKTVRTRDPRISLTWKTEGRKSESSWTSSCRTCRTWRDNFTCETWT